ncbi:hypothetical protein GIB67_020619 [Kingdonia uniflora]|uniref:non-specific serine/threonine protein kinase n=1 Tax=Kingdonia uniflora TaxID=39325 RepID=A0A7J7M8S3_9MAGN|nr:hypothetical protein GIB67_020619 [Kingdonia uniflora]
MTVLYGSFYRFALPDLNSLVIRTTSDNNILFRALNSNNFSGTIPPTLGNLPKLYWLDLAGNQLTGTISVSTALTPGLDLLLSAKHFHFNKNLLSGSIPPQIFNSCMILIHIWKQVNCESYRLLDGGELTGSIPTILGHVKSLEVLRLDRNSLKGLVPSNLQNLTRLNELDLSNNSFDPSGAPGWFSTIDSLTTLVMENGNLQGPVPEKLFSFSQIQQVLVKNPVCDQLGNTNYCNLQQQEDIKNYSTSLANCGTDSCIAGQKLIPQSYDYLLITMSLFPSTEKYFNRSEVQRIGFAFKNGGKMSLCIIIGISIGCVFLLLVLAGVAIYAIQQKKLAERAIELSKPFGNFVILCSPAGKNSGGALQLKGARWFSYDEVKKCTSNFLESNQIGSGGYRRVYRGMFPSGKTVAIKRAQQGSMQGGDEFKTEIELLSRVHQRTSLALLVSVLSKENKWRSGIYLDWKRRLRIALGFARGLTYLHELANPSIIHRDVKSTNILLDEKLTAKVADFGLSKLTAKRGMYPLKLKLTDNSDVYSFGVVMLELISARQLIEKGKYIVREVRTALYKNSEHYGLKEITDPGIRNSGILIGFERFVELAMQCVEESAAERTSMSDVVKEIDRGTRTDDPTACKMHYL